VFLSAQAVIRRYGWGRAKGYANLKDRSIIPPPVMTSPDRWRMDQLLAWEDARIAAQPPPVIAEPPAATASLLDRLPQPKRAARRNS
jgi:hypothetical protein